jgi:hypothetical protein
MPWPEGMALDGDGHGPAYGGGRSACRCSVASTGVGNPWRLTRFEPDEAHKVVDFLVEAIKLEEAVKTCLSRHQIPNDATFGRAVERLRPVFLQHNLGDTDWAVLKDVITIRNWIVHHAPTPGYFEDLSDENSYIAVWEGKHGRPIQIADIDQAADDAWRLASLVGGLRPI